MQSSFAQTFMDKQLWDGCFYSGSWVPGVSQVEVKEPATGKVLGRIGMADAKCVSNSAMLAHRAQPEWAGLHYDERSAVLRRAARLAEENAAQIVEWVQRESGSTFLKASFEVSMAVKVLHEASALPSRSVGEMLPSTPGRLSIARRRPLGVVGVISPFNFPLYLAMRAVAPALALGNAVVLKPDPRTAVCGGVAIARLFELAGLPAGVLHVLPGDRGAGQALVADPRIAMIQFTGSTGAGRKVGEAAGRHLKKVSLELGGKNSLIVLDDADLEVAVANAAWGAYLHQGQICAATGRVLVQRGIYDRFIERLTAKAASLRVGDPVQAGVTLGPLIDATQRDNVARVVANAQRGGAKVEIGGKFHDLFFEPTVLSGVTPENAAFTEEIFGPVAVVVPFETDEDAIALANRTEYGLSTGIITANVGRALRLGERIRTGLLHVNDQTVGDDVINPFGGVGVSGNGTSIGGPANWEEFTQWQWMTIKGEAPRYEF
jgi:benzaldehyde dehydrogenase (NAD)